VLASEQGSCPRLLKHLVFANLETRSLVGRRTPRTTRLEGPAFPTKEEPVLAGVELTPTVALDEDQRSRVTPGFLEERQRVAGGGRQRPAGSPSPADPEARDAADRSSPIADLMLTSC